jgi:hypothetical protein
MKKYLAILLAVGTAFTIITFTVFAAPAAKSINLLSISYGKGGIVLIFETSGLTKSELKENSFYADSNYQKMACNFVDDTTKVRCTISKAFAGKGDFQATLAGFVFWGELPQEKISSIICGEGEESWYAFDVYEYGEYTESGEMPVELWNLYEEFGVFDFFAEEFGALFQITDTFCGPEIDLSETE